MGIGVSIFLLALGAILAFAVDFEASGLDINTVGVILMVVARPMAPSFLFWDRMGFGSTASRRSVRTDYVDDGVVVGSAPRSAVRERTVVRDDQVL